VATDAPTMLETSAIPEAMSPEEIERQVRGLGEWFHNLDLRGVQTAPRHFLGDFPRVLWEGLQHKLPDVRGKTVLDIGCNAGFYSIQLKKRGAARVLGIDFDERYLEQARFATRVCGADVELRQMSVYDVAALREKFDVVLFMGVLYHLRHPLLALDLVREHVVKDTMIFQCMLRGSEQVDPVERDYPFTERAIFDRPGHPRMHFIENRYASDPTNWWAPNSACMEAMLRASGFRIDDRLPPEVFVCRTAPIEESGAVYPAR
jgi:tRNA (mo5U34)-methyltransferase